MAGSDRYRAYVKKEKRRLKGLPYFTVSDEKRRAFLGMFDELDRHAEERAALDAILGWRANGCSDPIYRVLALEYLRHRAGDTLKDGGQSWPETALAEDAHVHSDLHVRGNLRNAAGLTVLGDLRVDGAYVTNGDHPCLQVGGVLHVRDLFACEAETIALGGVHVEGTLWVSYNHTITIAPFVEASVVCEADAHIDAEVRAEHHHVDRIPTVDLFGVEGDDDVEPHVAAWMLARNKR